MGNLYIPMSALLRVMGAEIILPPQNNKQTLTLGTRYSPETICLPYKLNLGNYIQALDAGANTLIMFQAPGTCRLGNYATLAEEKLRELGYDFEMVIFDLYGGKFKEIINKFSCATGKKNTLKSIKGIKIALAKFNALDKIEKGMFYLRPREVITGNAENIYKQGVYLIDKAESTGQVQKIVSKIMAKYKTVNINKSKEILKIFLIGEFFVLLDTFTNMNIEKELGRMGVEVNRQIMLSEWIGQSLIPKWLRKIETHKERAIRTAKPYIKRVVGGECVESIGDTVYASEQNNIDGVLHLGPFNCIPEIMSQCILPHISRNENIPVISLLMDEHTGKAGIMTRLEAFVDLMRRNKNKLQIA